MSRPFANAARRSNHSTLLQGPECGNSARRPSICPPRPTSSVRCVDRASFLAGEQEFPASLSLRRVTRTHAETSIQGGRKGAAGKSLRGWTAIRELPGRGGPQDIARGTTMEKLTTYPRLLERARRALGLGMPATAARFLARARKEPGCARRPEALELSRQLARLLPHRGLADAWEQQVLTGHTSPVTSVAFSGDGRFVLTGSCGEPPRLWELANGRCRPFVREGGAGGTSIAWSPDGRFALSSSPDRTLRLWEISSGRCVDIFRGHEARVTSVAWGPAATWRFPAARTGQCGCGESHLAAACTNFRARGPTTASRFSRTITSSCFSSPWLSKWRFAVWCTFSHPCVRLLSRTGTA
jgi:hypothetical protein